jgi:RimJ/RimL family protein N-acetyltransferase
MVEEGTLRKSTRYHGELVDDLLMSILRDEWEGLERREVEKTSG